MYFAHELNCAEVRRDLVRLMQCELPADGQVTDFMVVGKKGWQARENLITECVKEGLIRDSQRPGVNE